MHKLDNTIGECCIVITRELFYHVGITNRLCYVPGKHNYYQGIYESRQRAYLLPRSEY